MDYQLTENQTWAQVLLFIVYQPIVANKTGKYPLSEIISQFPVNERAKVKQGIDALIEMHIFVMDGRDICITNKSESLFQGLEHIAGKPAEAVEDMLRKTAPAFSSLLATINNDSRFAPPIDPLPTNPRSGSASSAVTASEVKPTGLGNKIVLGVFLLIVLLGLVKLIFRY